MSIDLARETEGASAGVDTAWNVDKTILLIAILTLNISQFIPIHSGFIFSFLMLFSLIRSSWKTLPCTLVCFFMELFGWMAPGAWNQTPIVGFLLPFFGTSIVLIFLSRLVPHEKFFDWLSFGKINRFSRFLIILTSILSTAALIAWAFWTNHLGLGEQFVRGFGDASKLLIFGVYIPAFALLNAFAEEMVYRGFIQESLSRVFSNPLVILVFQASAFAAAHFRGGFPNGWTGYGMVFIYGSMLGFLRMRTRGMLAPYIAHVIADYAIALLLVYLVK